MFLYSNAKAGPMLQAVGLLPQIGSGTACAAAAPEASIDSSKLVAEAGHGQGMGGRGGFQQHPCAPDFVPPFPKCPASFLSIDIHHQNG